SKQTIHIANSTHFHIDVTDAVRAWQSGSQPNHGFVFRGPDESLGNYNSMCESTYGHFNLGVDFFK
ncbi:MAG: hypothetical protein JOY86_03370, partial [Candidatus Eremiobacteraeota bacterium]|nr:hypothetical protein [Candidatus Eremiobacteraeota bacterium]